MDSFNTRKITGNEVFIAFYAPLKSPLHPIPSGDRKIARLFFQALQLAGFEVELASNLRSFDKSGSAVRQARLVELAKREARRIITRWQRQGNTPKAWFSYHLYYKAPDLIGPLICAELNIPYIVAEASWAKKRALGAWSTYHDWIDRALRQATRVICINPIDRIALEQFYALMPVIESPLYSLPVFIDVPSIPQKKDAAMRLALAREFSLSPMKPWLVSIAMMRKGDKHTSYQLLAKTLSKVSIDYQCLIIGAGPNYDEVATLFASNNRVVFAGQQDNTAILSWLNAFEILVWPAVNEALGMIFLEAGASGVAVVAGNQGGVPSIVEHNVSGFLCDADDTKSMAAAITTLLESPSLLLNMQHSGQHKIHKTHSLNSASQKLKEIIDSL